MPIVRAHSFLVLPAKNEPKAPGIRGVQIPPGNPVFAMLTRLYDGAEAECDIDIQFRHAPDGTQNNACRDLLIAYVNNPTLTAGRSIATRLQGVTTRRSGLGLLFTVKGSEARRVLMIARFPADQGVIAEEREKGGLEVEFIERVFMKTSHAYKNVIYAGPTIPGSFWQGRAVDKQIDDRKELPNYWIGDFLDSDLLTTGAAGTKRLAVAFRQGIRASQNPLVREELMAAARLARGQAGKLVRADRLAQAYGLSDEAIEVLIEEFPRRELFHEPFRFELSEFDRHVMYRSLELNNGAVLMAENARFDDIFKKDPITDTEAVYSTRGSIVMDQLRKTI